MFGISLPGLDSLFGGGGGVGDIGGQNKGFDNSTVKTNESQTTTNDYSRAVDGVNTVGGDRYDGDVNFGSQRTYNYTTDFGAIRTAGGAMSDAIDGVTDIAFDSNRLANSAVIEMADLTTGINQSAELLGTDALKTAGDLGSGAYNLADNLSFYQTRLATDAIAEGNDLATDLTEGAYSLAQWSINENADLASSVANLSSDALATSRGMLTDALGYMATVQGDALAKVQSAVAGTTDSLNAGLRSTMQFIDGITRSDDAQLATDQNKTVMMAILAAAVIGGLALYKRR